MSGPAAETEPYRALAGPVSGELREQGSRFLALGLPVTAEPAARQELRRIEESYRDATHHCWAWRLGAERRERSSDAGEPAGTAGVPILQVLRGADASDLLAVVVRWFGGTKLGKGGLARAYTEATRRALAEADWVRKVPTATLSVVLPYDRIGAVKRLLHPPEVELVTEAYRERAHLTLRVTRRRLGELEQAVRDLGLEPSASD